MNIILVYAHPVRKRNNDDMTNKNTNEIIILYLFLCERFMKYYIVIILICVSLDIEHGLYSSLNIIQVYCSSC